MAIDHECRELTGELKFDTEIDYETGYIKEANPEDTLIPRNITAPNDSHTYYNTGAVGRPYKNPYKKR